MIIIITIMKFPTNNINSIMQKKKRSNIKIHKFVEIGREEFSGYRFFYFLILTRF